MTNRHEHWYKYVINFLLVYIIIKWKRSIRSDWELSEKILLKSFEWTRFNRYFGSIFQFLTHVLTNILWIRPWTSFNKKKKVSNIIHTKPQLFDTWLFFQILQYFTSNSNIYAEQKDFLLLEYHLSTHSRIVINDMELRKTFPFFVIYSAMNFEWEFLDCLKNYWINRIFNFHS